MLKYDSNTLCPKCGEAIRFGKIGWNVQGEPEDTIYCRCTCGYHWLMLPLDAEGEDDGQA